MISFLRKLGWLRDRPRKEAELEEELRFHLDEETEDRALEGLSAEDARRAARRDLGGVALVREDTRAEWGWTTLEQFGQDLRYAYRTMASNRSFTILAALSLALSIGANTAIYSFMDWILMRALPVQDPGSLVVMNWRARVPRRMGDGKVWHSASGSIYDDGTGDGKTGVTAAIFPFPAFEIFRQPSSPFSAVFGFSPAGELNLTVEGSSGSSGLVRSEYVTGDYFRGLGVSAAAGRLLTDADDVAGAPAVAVVGFGLARRRFGSPEAALDRSVWINNAPFQVVGVAPPEFFGVNPASVPEMFVPMRSSPLLEAEPATAREKFLDPNFYWLEIMARLRPGIAREQAEAILAPAFRHWVEGTATNAESRANLPQLVLRDGAGGLDALRRRFSKPLYVLMLLVGLVLAIACANIANLLLARAEARRREIAVRLSLGAGRGRIVRQLLTESVVLAALGGALGVLFAIWGIRFLGVLLAGESGVAPRAELNGNVLAAAAALCVLTGVAFGLAPALQAARVNVLPALKESRAGRAPARLSFPRFRLAHALVASQIAMSLLLLFAAGLFLRTLSNLHAVDVGFRRENLLLFRLNARQAGHRGEEMVRFYADVRRRLAAVPGVVDASLSNEGGLFEAGFSLDEIRIGDIETKGTQLLFVGPEFFRTMGIPVLLGREFASRDRLGSPEVAVVSESFAKTNFGTENPLGRRLTMRDPDPRDMEIVGVAKDARYGGVKRELPPVVYAPYDQGALKFVDEMTYVVRTAGDPRAYENTMREIVRQADPRVPVAGIQTQQAQIDGAIHEEIAFARLCTMLGLLALVITCVGLYGTVSYNVARRTNEIGIRMALGARRASVVWRVLREVLVLAAVALAISVPAAVVGSAFVESFLFGMKPNDPLTVWSAVLTLLVAASAAAYVPARRASRISPMTALRHE